MTEQDPQNKARKAQLSYNVLGLCSYSFDPKAVILNSLQIHRDFRLILEVERYKGFDEEFGDTLFLRCEAT